MELEQRIDKLERQNRRMRLLGLVALLAVGSVFLMGQAEEVPREIKAKQFAVVDDKGEYRAVLNVTERGPSLAMRDSKGTYRVTLLAADDGPGLAFYGEEMNLRVLLSDKLEFHNAKGKVIHKVP